MKPGRRVNRVDLLERKRDLLDAVEGMSRHHKAGMLARIMKEVVVSKISAAAVNEIRKTVNV